MTYNCSVDCGWIVNCKQRLLETGNVPTTENKISQAKTSEDKANKEADESDSVATEIINLPSSATVAVPSSAKTSIDKVLDTSANKTAFAAGPDSAITTTPAAKPVCNIL